MDEKLREEVLLNKEERKKCCPDDGRFHDSHDMLVAQHLKSRQATLREVKPQILKYLTEDSETKDARRKDFNQAIFDSKEGWQIFCNTTLDMVMTAVHKAIAALKSGELPEDKP